MNLRIILIVLAGVCSVWYVVTTIMIYADLRRRGQKVNFLWLRIAAPWYASRYRAMTKAENGMVGPLFYHWIVSINLALFFAVLLLVFSPQ
jgi:hypothetical protein